MQSIDRGHKIRKNAPQIIKKWVQNNVLGLVHSRTSNTFCIGKVIKSDARTISIDFIFEHKQALLKHKSCVGYKLVKVTRIS